MRYLATIALALGHLATSAQSEDQKPLVAFVGERISVERVSDPEDNWNFHFKAKYRVIETVCGDVDRDLVEFSGADHYSFPPGFANYRFVLLCFTRVGDRFVHTGGYSWSPVYRTKDGRWAGRYNAADYMFYHERADDPVIKPEVIEFPEEATRILEEWELKNFDRGAWEPYWRLTGNRLIPLQGNYLQDLFELKKIAWLDDAYDN